MDMDITSWCHPYMKNISGTFIYYLEIYPAVTSILIIFYLFFLVGGGSYLGRRFSSQMSRDLVRKILMSGLSDA
jgi:hypothetical protein